MTTKTSELVDTVLASYILSTLYLCAVVGTGTVVIGTGENGPRIVGDPVMARNGIVYRIDRVIPPAG